MAIFKIVLDSEIEILSNVLQDEGASFRTVPIQHAFSITAEEVLDTELSKFWLKYETAEGELLTELTPEWSADKMTATGIFIIDSSIGDQAILECKLYDIYGNELTETRAFNIFDLLLVKTNITFTNRNINTEWNSSNLVVSFLTT